MTKFTRLLGMCVLIGVVLFPAQAHAVDTYSAEPIEAWVVDAETNQPIEGVIVTANWQLEYGTAGGNVPRGQMMVMETVTDKNGRFYFPAWGPKPIPSYNITARDWQEALYLSLFPVELHLVYRDPRLLLFKRDYKYVGLENKLITNYNKGSLRRSDWNGKTIKMEQFKGTFEEYANHLDDMSIYLRFAYSGKDCEWKQVPRMIAALHRVSLEVEAQDVKLRGWRGGARIYKIDDIKIPKDSQCGSVQEFFRSYLQ